MLMLVLQKVGIEVLRAVGEEHHEGHQHDEEQEALPVAVRFAQDGAKTGQLVLQPGFGFRHFAAYVESK